MPCLILYAHFQISKSVLGCYIWISSSNSSSQTTGTIYKIRTLKKDDFIKYSLILNIHPSYPPPKYCGHQNPIPRCLFGTIIKGSEVYHICCVHFAYSWAKQFVGLLITFFSDGLYSISSINIKTLGYNISHLHYDWDNIRMQPWIHKFIILLGVETFFKY